ncbi:MAG: hypothetical protein ACK4UJ_08365 [Leptonema sp. (in: bacteria)]
MNSVMIDDSILFYLTFPNPYKEKIIDLLKEVTKNHKSLVSNLYAFLKIQSIFIKYNHLNNFYEFYRDCNEFIATIYPIDLRVYNKALHTCLVYSIDFDISLYIELLKEFKISYLFSARITKKEREIIKNHFSIEIIDVT